MRYTKEYVKANGIFSKKNTLEALICSGWENRKKRDDDDDKRLAPYNILVEQALAKFS